MATEVEARPALEAYSQCVVRQSPDEAGRVLAMDFTTTNYRTGLKKLADGAAKQCAVKSFDIGKLRSSNLLFAGEVAEALLESRDVPLRNGLARAAATEAAPSFSFTDKVAICVVRSAPDQVAALFETPRGSAEEGAAIAGLGNVAGLCAKAAEATRPLEINPAGLRAMLATAAFRLLTKAEAPA